MSGLMNSLKLEIERATCFDTMQTMMSNLLESSYDKRNLARDRGIRRISMLRWHQPLLEMANST